MKFVPFASGSKGNAYFVESNGTKILIDIGISLRKCITYLSDVGVKPDEINGIIVTHAHADHMRSVPGFARKYKTPVYASRKTLKRMTKWLDIESVTIELTDNSVIGSLDLSVFQTYHDIAGSTGISVSNNNSRITIITDTGKIDDKILSYAERSDILVLEANYDKEMLWNGPYPRYIKARIDSDYGHLSNDSALALLSQCKLNNLKALYIGHISENNNSLELVNKLFTDSVNSLRHNDILLEIAHQHKLSVPFEIPDQ